MQRSVMKQGPNTLVISLPSSWVKKKNVRKGDSLSVEEYEDALYISPNKKSFSSKITLDVSNTAPMTKRIAGALYKAGYDEITLLYKTAEELEQIQACFEHMIGHEIMETKQGMVKIKKLASPDPEEFDNLLRKQFFTLQSMAEESLKALRSHDLNLLKEVIARDVIMGKFADFCRRHLVKQGCANQHQTPLIYYLVEQLEKIGDVYKNICKEALVENDKNNKLEKENSMLYEEVNKYLKFFDDLYYNFSLEKITLFGKKGMQLKNKLQLAFKKTKREQLVLINHLSTITELLHDLNGPVLMVFLQVQKDV